MWPPSQLKCRTFPSPQNVPPCPVEPVPTPRPFLGHSLFWFLSSRVSSACARASYSWSQAVGIILCLASFTQKTVFKTCLALVRSRSWLHWIAEWHAMVRGWPVRYPFTCTWVLGLTAVWAMMHKTGRNNLGHIFFVEIPIHFTWVNIRERDSWVPG